MSDADWGVFIHFVESDQGDLAEIQQRLIDVGVSQAAARFAVIGAYFRGWRAGRLAERAGLDADPAGAAWAPDWSLPAEFETE